MSEPLFETPREAQARWKNMEECKFDFFGKCDPKLRDAEKSLKGDRCITCMLEMIRQGLVHEKYAASGYWLGVLTRYLAKKEIIGKTGFEL
jgi:hypothetical protein